MTAVAQWPSPLALSSVDNHYLVADHRTSGMLMSMVSTVGSWARGL